jgi:protein MBA1
VPEEARVKQETKKLVARQHPRLAEHGSSAKPTRVVEYLVLQNRVVARNEEDWKVWGFTEESTPAKIEDDAEYWRKQLSAQAAAVA